jgi:hypothetical protein
MATFGEMTADNPYIREQYDEWGDARVQNGEDPTDWDAFREHVMALGAPDPGNRPPDDFVGEDWKAENPDWVARYADRA